MSFEKDLKDHKILSKRPHFISNKTLSILATGSLVLGFISILLILVSINNQTKVLESPTAIKAKMLSDVYSKDEGLAYLSLEFKRKVSAKNTPIEVKFSLVNSRERKIANPYMYSYTLLAEESELIVAVPINVGTGEYKLIGWVFEYTRDRMIPSTFETGVFEIK